MAQFILITIGVIVTMLVIAGLKRRFAPETLANGCMDLEKGSEIAPTIFPTKE